MRLCAYWDCMEEVDEGMSFCREHGRMLNRQLIDKCPKCGRYKDSRQKFCPDCNYGRPVADWKVSSRNLDEVTEYMEPSSPQNPENSYVNPASPISYSGGSSPPRGEALCPSCGSANLTYKEVFDYFRCNACDTTFVTPVYSYGEAGLKAGGIPSPQPQNRQNVIQPPVQQPQYRREQPYIQQPSPQQLPPAQWQDPGVQQQSTQWLGSYAQQPPVQWQEPQMQPLPVQREETRSQVKKSQLSLSSGKIPNLDIMRRHELEERAMNQRAIKTPGQKSNLGWIYLLIVVCIIALIALIGWFFFNEQILSAIDSLS